MTGSYKARTFDRAAIAAAATMREIGLMRDDGKLVGADAGDHIQRPHQLAQAPCHGQQQLAQDGRRILFAHGVEVADREQHIASRPAT